MKGIIMGIVEVEGREGAHVVLAINGGEPLITTTKHALSIYEQLGVLLEQLGMFPDDVPDTSGVIH